MSERPLGPDTPDFTYREGALHAEHVPLARIAAEVGTPFYCYSSTGIERQYRRFAASFAGHQVRICFAVKANGNLAVLKTLARLGSGADVLSEGEFRRALAAGIPGSRIIFSGVGKSASEMTFALAQDVHQINVESLPELQQLSAVASAMGRTAPIALRVNPDVDARTHAKIATGKKENKFGIDLRQIIEAYRLAAELPGLEPLGIAVHIGSQLTELQPLETAFRRVLELTRELRAVAGIALTRLDLGGGLGIRYRGETPPPIEAYAAMVKRVVGTADLELAFEPGRFIVGNQGALVTKVLYVKDSATKRFLIVDAAMNDLIRPSLYEAWHAIVPVREADPDHFSIPVEVVGPVCETGDTFASERMLPKMAAGELAAILSAGAYGAAMSSEYNSRLLVPEVLVRESDFAVVRPRPSFESLLAKDCFPDWLKPDWLKNEGG
ncbi:MAG TPA: diaminopimelate decarboxylase [Stellaceae bacterium]|nr:diaminopimelate decarboxylase [Stellaceae bacterium]